MSSWMNRNIEPGCQAIVIRGGLENLGREVTVERWLEREEEIQINGVPFVSVHPGWLCHAPGLYADVGGCKTKLGTSVFDTQDLMRINPLSKVKDEEKANGLRV